MNYLTIIPITKHQEKREAFEGNVCVQTFLHYNDADGRFGKENIFDKRPMLGIPK